ncbi:MAG: hypothetical protein LBU89_08165 [Fibromonadaceae bacterium]|jgi:hypothetical protein|nr:hypothetical protein [Fibromonadaceae bacterium]
MRVIIYAFLFLCIIGCAQSVQKPLQRNFFSFENMDCPEAYIKGMGMGENRQIALEQAIADVSSQVQHLITVGVQQSQAKHMEENVMVVVCMSREDAAKPYLNQLSRINDSLNLAIQTELAQSHPRAKRKAAREAEDLRMRQIMTMQILQGLGKNVELQSTEAYERMVKDYEEFSSNFKFIWEGDGEQISQILVSKISSRYKIETGTCVQGLKLVPIATDISCEYGKFGPHCSYAPILEGRSCSDELYFVLKGVPVRTTGERSENESKRKLLAQIPNAQFWNNWFEELDKYK